MMLATTDPILAPATGKRTLFDLVPDLAGKLLPLSMQRPRWPPSSPTSSNWPPSPAINRSPCCKCTTSPKLPIWQHGLMDKGKPSSAFADKSDIQTQSGLS